MVRRLVAAVAFTALIAPVAVVAGAGTASGASASSSRWIVVLHDDAGSPSAVASEHARRHGAQVGHVYSHALRGYAATMSATALERIRNDSRVAYVEADGSVSVVHHRDDHTGGPGADDGGDSGGDTGGSGCSQVLPWGIDRVEADLSPTAKAGDCTGAVTSVHVYVIDTGVGKHSDLNLAGHVNFVGGKNTDCHGHGTHVAGTTVARDNSSDVVGVLPGAPVVGVKVLGCGGTGSTSGVIAGVDWVTANAKKPAVANMSLGGGASNALDDAVRKSAASGVTYAVAAGNSGADACNASPARAGTTNGVITTAAIDSSGKEASWSNYGSCVDVWAPGVSVLSTKLGGGTTTMSGTSMASPHAAGVAGVWRATHSGTAADVEAAVKSVMVTTGHLSKDGRTITLVQASTF